ncbi:MAG: hypothetical protein R3F18_06745 [Lysobacterales bacterium]
MIDAFCITLALMVGTGLPHVIVRFFIVPKVKGRPHQRRIARCSSPSRT